MIPLDVAIEGYIAFGLIGFICGIGFGIYYMLEVHLRKNK